MLWLRVRRLDQFLAASWVVGLLGAGLGTRTSPVPGQLFADVAGVPLVYLGPAIVAVSLAQTSPVGIYWPETKAAPRSVGATVVLGLVLGFAPPLLVTGAGEVSLVATRNAVLLAGLVLLVRRYGDAPSATATVLAPSFVVWTFGWDPLGEPQPWAILLAPASASIPLVVTGLVLAAALDAVRRLAGHGSTTSTGRSP